MMSEKVRELLDSLLELKTEMIDKLMIEMLLTYVVENGYEEEFREFSRDWLIEKFMITHKKRGGE